MALFVSLPFFDADNVVAEEEGEGGGRVEPRGFFEEEEKVGREGEGEGEGKGFLPPSLRTLIEGDGLQLIGVKSSSLGKESVDRERLSPLDIVATLFSSP
mmetsp:Transcript_34482/g.47125  ORF Transcript_34482/g.47125 Transcript_34482/m.47125 type:complete len:100 (+) Transcript_34482:119-418(+)